MAEVLEKIPDIIEMIALGCLAIVILATIVVRFTPSKVDDEYVSSAGRMLMKALAFLPTVGINPRTKKLEQAYEELKAQLPKVPSSEPEKSA